MPISPFEVATAAAQDPPSEVPGRSRKQQSQSPDEVWNRLSDDLLASGDQISKADEQNLKECLRWWCRQHDRKSQEYCWGLWEQWKDAFSESSDTAELWMSVIDCWRLSVADGIIVRTPEQVLEEMQALNLTDQTKSYGILLDGLSLLGRPQDAQDLLETLDTKGIRPNRVMWNTVLTAWARSGHVNAADRALRLLDQLETRDDGPDHVSYSAVLEGLSNGIRADHRDKKAIEKVEEVFARSSNKGLVSEVAWLQRLQAWGKIDVEMAKTLLYQLRDAYNLPNGELRGTITPNHRLFSVVMSACARSGDMDSVRLLWEDLVVLHQRHLQSMRDEPSPFKLTAATLNSVLQAFAYVRIPDRAEKAQAFLEAALEQDMEVDRTSFNTVLDVWAGSQNRKHIESIQYLLEVMRNRGDEYSPDTYSFNALLKAFSRSNRRDALQVSEQVLKEMKEAGVAGDVNAKANHISYASVLSAYSRLAKPSEVGSAERLFGEMWDEYNRQEDPDLLPTEAAYVSIITTWIRSKRKEAASRAAYYFDHFRALSAKFPTNSTRFQPSARIYNTLIDSKKLVGDGRGAEEILQRMIGDFRGGNTKAEPSTVTFNTVMTAWSKSSDKRAPQRVEELLRVMDELARVEEWQCNPNTWTYAIVLETWSALRSTRGAERADAVFRNLQQHFDVTQDERLRPSSHCYATVMVAWSRSGSPDAPEKTQAIFDEMMQKFEDGDAHSRPSGVAYIALLTAWSRSMRPDAPPRTLAILNEMADRHQSNPERYEKPDSWHYSAVINAFAERGDAESAESILERVLRSRDGVSPNRGCWNGVLKAYVRSKISDAPERASDVLRKMYEYADSGYGEASPDSATYTTLLEVWRASGRKEAFFEGLRVLEEMLEKSKSRKRLEPDAGVFLSLLRILGSSKVADKDIYVKRVTELMRERRIQPSTAIHLAIMGCRNEEVAR